MPNTGDPNLDQLILNVVNDVNSLTGHVGALTSYTLPPPPPPPPPPPTNIIARNAGDAIWSPGQGGDNSTVVVTPHNMPLGDGCVGDGIKLNGPYWNFNTVGYGWSVGSYPKPPGPVNGLSFIAQRDNVENHVSLIDLTHSVEYNYYQYGLAGEQMTGTWDMHGKNNPAPNVNMGASGLPHSLGIIRVEDLNDGGDSKTPFRHAIHAALDATQLDKRCVSHPGAPGPGVVYPAYRCDGYSGNYSGHVPVGARIFIPFGTPMPGGLSINEQRLFLTLMFRGAIVHDRGPCFLGEAHTAGAFSNANCYKLLQLMELVTNIEASPNLGAKIGGPGGPMAPYLAVY